jgi:peptidoglycan/xylan/chitin deacetylase (PgdA/CDA1 family)
MFLGKDIEAIATSRPVVALTFDAGANADALPAILGTLSAERIPATFLLTGDFATRYASAVRSIVAGGHRLGNHTVTHPYCTGLSSSAIQQEITAAEAQIRTAGGTTTRPLFRFPYGDRDARTIAAVNDAGYVAVRWTVDSLGWQGASAGITVQRVVDRVVGGRLPQGDCPYARRVAPHRSLHARRAGAAVRYRRAERSRLRLRQPRRAAVRLAGVRNCPLRNDQTQ